MKKIVAIILAALMICSAMITVAAAEDEVLTAPEFQGIQTRVNETDSSKSDVRFISTVNSLKGDKLGFEVVAKFVNAKDETKTITYTGEKTEGSIVYSSILAGEKTILATDYNENAKGIYVFTITGMPNAYYTEFDVTTYVVSGDTTVKSTATYEHQVVGGKGVEQSYKQTFEGTVAQDYGVSKPYAKDMLLSVENDRLFVPSISYNANRRYFAALVDKENFQDAVRDIKGTANEAYVLEMEVEINSLTSAFGFVFNGGDHTNAETTGFSEDVANGAALTFRNGVLAPTWGYYLGDGTQKTMWTTPEKAMNLLKLADSDATTTIGTKKLYNLAYVVNGARIDLFIDETWVFGFDHSGYDLSTDDGITEGSAQTQWDAVNSSIKEESMILMWAQDSSVYIDNVKISIPDSKIAANDATMTLPERTATYTQTFNSAAAVDTLKTTYGVSQVPNVTGADVPMEVNNGALQVFGGAWGLNWFVLADASKVAATDGVLVFETNLAINAHGTMNFTINNKALATTSADLYTDMKANGFVTQFQSATETGYNVRYQYSTGSAFTAGTAEDVALNKSNINLKVVANGNKYSIYIDGNFVTSYTYGADAEGRAVNENTNIILWAQNPADISIDDITIYTAK